MFRTPALLVLAAFAAVVSLSAQTSNAPSLATPFDGSPFAKTAAEMRSASASILAEKTADVTILFEETTYKISATNMLSYTSRRIFRIESHAGVENWSEISLDWDPWYQNPSQLHARVLQPGGSFVELDQKTITDAPLNSTETETYTSSRQRKGPLPGLAVGSIVEQVATVDEKKPYFPGGSAYRYAFTNSAPTAHERLIVETPVGTAFAERVTNLPDLAVTRTEANGLRRAVYELGPKSTTVYGDIDLASKTAPIPQVEFSTGGSWAAEAKDYAALSDPRIVTGDVMSLLPAQPAATRRALIQQLVERLHKEVRYTGVEFDEAQFTPQTPAEVLKRHYGDCKDKATMLVAMLRAAKIPANLALLYAGDGLDVNPELPGLNRFNHAIVYVPAEGAELAVWIDATADFMQVGYLPNSDAGRLALIISPETTGLTKIPEGNALNSVLVETRTFTLADVGPSRVVEASQTSGSVDSSYRSIYGSTISQKTKDNLEEYVKSAYLAKSLGPIEHGDGADLSKPFELKITAENARRGGTSLVDAAVAIFPTGTFNGLPQWIRTAAQPLPEDATAEQKQQRAKAEAQRSPTYRMEPFTTEQRYRILAPAGFVARPLPADRVTKLGPATLTEHYVAESPRVVLASLKLAVDKPEITAQEALDFRQAVAEANTREFVLITFAQQAASLAAEGKIKEALAAGREEIAENPKSALPHVRMARVLLGAGVGDLARMEAAKAVELEPGSAASLTTLGWVLENDQLGVRFGLGFDRSGAIAAFRKALPLKSEDFDPRFDLAILLEFNANGERYGAGANLADAVALYRDLIETEKKKNSAQVPQYRVNLAYTLLFEKAYKDLDALLPDLGTGINRNTLTILSAVVQKDVAAGMSAAEKLNASADDRNKALLAAGGYLAQLGLYAQASQILDAGVQGQKDATTSARQAELFRNLHRVPLASPPVTSAESAVFAEMNLMFSGVFERGAVGALLSRHAYGSAAGYERNLDKNMQSMGLLHTMSQANGMAEPVLRDLIVGGLTMKATGDDATGYRVIAQMIGGQTEHFFVVKEDGTFRIVASASDNSEVGRYALYALEQSKPALAKSILDWKRDLLHKGGGDDPFSGPLLPRFWTVGSSKEGADSPEAMRVAAISLLASSAGMKPLLDSLVPLREKASGSHQTDFDLLLALGYLGSEEPALALTYNDRLLKEEPDSNTALSTASAAYTMNRDFAAWKAMLAPRLAKKPTDLDLLRSQVRLNQSQHDFVQSRVTGKILFDSGKAEAADYNNYAWSGLFDHHLGADVTEAAQQANMKSNNTNFGALHTLASIDAAQGKITEAQQTLLQVMAKGNMTQPNSAVWYVLGLLYEDYGLKEAALGAYGRVQAHEFDDHTFIDPTSTYVLAQERVKALGR